MNAEKFSDFFGGAEIYRIPGRTFPVRVVWDKCAADDFVNAAVKKCIEVHVQQGPGKILCFLKLINRRHFDIYDRSRGYRDDLQYSL